MNKTKSPRTARDAVKLASSAVPPSRRTDSDRTSFARYRMAFTPLRRLTLAAALERKDDIVNDYVNRSFGFRELRDKYNATYETLRRVMEIAKVEVRSSGRVPGKPSYGQRRLAKITPEQRTWLLDEDRKGTIHAEIARKLGISRERVRQICLESGRPPKSGPLTPEEQAARQRAIAADRERRRQLRQAKLMTVTPIIERASKLWLADKPVADIAKVLKVKSSSLFVWIARWRARWPDLFPRRNFSRGTQPDAERPDAGLTGGLDNPATWLC